MDIFFNILANFEYILIPFIILYFYLDRPFVDKDYDIYRFSINSLYTIAIFGTFWFLIGKLVVCVFGSLITIGNNPILVSIYHAGPIKSSVQVIALIIAYELSFYLFFIKRYSLNYLRVMTYSKEYEIKPLLSDKLEKEIEEKNINYGEIGDYIERVADLRLCTYLFGLLSIVAIGLMYYLSTIYVEDHYAAIEKYYPGIISSGEYTKDEIEDIANYINIQKLRNYQIYRALKPIDMEDSTDKVKELLKDIKEVVIDMRKE